MVRSRSGADTPFVGLISPKFVPDADFKLPARHFRSSAATQIVMTAPLTAPLSASVRGSGAPEGVRGVRGDTVNFRPLWGYARSVSPMPWGAWPEERAMQAAVGARSARIVGVVLVFLATGLASFSEAKLPARTGPTIKVLSNQPDLISGGDALVEILNAGTGSLRATLNGADISSAFALRPNGRVMGLVAGLIDGGNTLTVKSKTGSATITITNYPNGGPVFSRPPSHALAAPARAARAQGKPPLGSAHAFRPRSR